MPSFQTDPRVRLDLGLSAEDARSWDEYRDAAVGVLVDDGFEYGTALFLLCRYGDLAATCYEKEWDPYDLAQKIEAMPEVAELRRREVTERGSLGWLRRDLYAVLY